MTLDEIKELIQIVQQSGVAELEVQRGENRVRIRTGAAQMRPQEIVIAAGQPITAAAAAPGAVHSAVPVPAQSNSTAPANGAPEPQEEELTYVKSPIVGTFYESASPGTPPFVNVGDQVAPGKVLCIIESMKLMNEIESEVSGVIVRKLAENGKPVEYGQTLFAVRPS